MFRELIKVHALLIGLWHHVSKLGYFKDDLNATQFCKQLLMYLTLLVDDSVGDINLHLRIFLVSRELLLDSFNLHFHSLIELIFLFLDEFLLQRNDLGQLFYLQSLLFNSISIPLSQLEIHNGDIIHRFSVHI